MSSRLFYLAQKDLHWARKYLTSTQLSFGLHVNQWLGLIKQHPSLKTLITSQKLNLQSHKGLSKPKTPAQNQDFSTMTVDELKQRALVECEAAQYLVRHQFHKKKLSANDWVAIAANKPKLASFLLTQAQLSNEFVSFNRHQKTLLARWDLNVAKQLLSQGDLSQRDEVFLLSHHQELATQWLKSPKKQNLSTKQWLHLALAGPEAAQRIMPNIDECDVSKHQTILWTLSQRYLGMLRWLGEQGHLSQFSGAKSEVLQNQYQLDGCVLNNLNQWSSKKSQWEKSREFTPSYAALHNDVSNEADKVYTKKVVSKCRQS